MLTTTKPESHIQPLYPQDCRGAMIRVGIIGYGYWGPNIVRNLHGLSTTQLVMVCDKNPAALARARKAYPNVLTVSDPLELLRSPEIDAVAVITPVWTHYELAKMALENGKHVFIEKPFTSNSTEAEELIELALAPHDLSIMNHIIKDAPEAIVATGEKHLNGVEDVAFMTVYFPRNVIAHINVNWLSPVKIRTTLIGGQKQMVVWNDLVADEKVRVYDKGVQITSGDGIRDLLVSYRSGDMWAPQLEQLEALHVELEYFADCIMNNKIPMNDGHAGLRVVRMLEAAEKSIQKKGELVRL